MAIVGGTETRVNSHTLGGQIEPQITKLSDGGWVVTWWSVDQDAPGGAGVYQRAYNADGSTRSGEARVNSFVNDDQIFTQTAALTDGGWVVTWMSLGQDAQGGAGVYQQAYNANGSVQGGEVRVNFSTNGNQAMQQVTALADGGWVVTWMSEHQGGYPDVYQQAYNANGLVQGGETRVNTTALDYQALPQITALTDGGWVVTWRSAQQDGSDLGVYQQAYNADRSVRGGETRVNSFTQGEQYEQKVTALKDGGWVVTWVSIAQDAPGSAGVYQQAYNADGSIQGGEVRVNNHAAGDQSAQQVAALKDGGWVVTWQSNNQDGSGWGVYQQAYNADGSIRGGETQANSHTNGDQFKPQITALTDGGWVVTWVSDGQDGSLEGVYQRAYGANGSARGDEVRVNSYVDGNQSVPQITARADGGWVVTWQSDGQDGSSEGIYQRVFYTNNGAPAGADKTISVGEDGSYRFKAADFGFTDADGHSLAAVVIATLPAKGTLTLNGVAVTAGRTIAAADLDKLVWKPAANANGNGLTAFTFKVVDDGGTARGGQNTDRSPNTITFNVTPVNDAPVVSGTTPATLSIAEFSAKGAQVGTVRVTDPDGPAATFSLTDNAGGRFAIDAATGKITVLNGLLLDFEQAKSHQITVKVSDGAGGSISRTIVVKLTDVNPETVSGDSGSNTFVGGSGNDKFIGYGGSDRLSGGAGNDMLNGNAGNDTMTGGTGDDVYYVESSTDVVIELAGQGLDKVISSSSFTLSANVEVLTLTRSDLTGRGNSGDNVFYSIGSGNTLAGLAGNDIYVLGTANATIVEAAGGGIDLVYSEARHVLAANVENLTLGGTANVNGGGNNLANVLVGNAGANWLSGLVGNDTLTGGLGADTLRGGAGKDVFDFNAIADSEVGAGKRDMIGDFARGQDKIDLATIDANGLLAGNQAFAFLGAASFTGAGQLRYVQEGSGATAKTILWGNVDGNLGADFHIELKGHVALTAGDFVL